MRCPMRPNQYGYLAECEKEYCAWWDIAREQCCIKTLTEKTVYKENNDGKNLDNE